MDLEGMDVERAQVIAQQLDDSAQTLTRISGALGVLTTELLFHWRGSASAMFEQEWTALHQPALQAAWGAVTDMRAHLVANIAQQVQASAADGPTLLAVAGRVWADVQTADNIRDHLDKFRDRINRIAGDDLVDGRYSKTWTRVLRLTDDDPLLKYKSWPLLHSLHDSPEIQGASRFLEDPAVSRIFDVADKVAVPVAVIGGVISGVEGIHAVTQHHYMQAAGYGLTVASTGLMLSGVPPLMAVGAGIAIAQAIPWDKVAAVASHYLPGAMSVFADVSAPLSDKLQELF